MLQIVADRLIGISYTQCELMSAHYKQPMLLIEWEENKSFSLEVSNVILHGVHALTVF